MEGSNLTIKEEHVDLADLVLPPNPQENLEDYFQVKDELTELPKDTHNLQTSLERLGQQKDNFCELCSLQFGNKSVFDIHLSFVHGKNITKIKEEAAEPNAVKRTGANVVILQPRSMKKHITIVHEGEKPLKCLICNYSASRKQHLDMHITSVHEVKKTFKCSICDASFAQSANLKTHIATIHEGQKPFKCSICDSSFRLSANLKTHIKAVHEGQKPFKCSICDASFTQSGSLKTHIKAVHEGQKPNVSVAKRAK